MAALAMAIELEISSSDDALLFLKQLVDAGTPPDIIRDVIRRACEQLNLRNARERQPIGMAMSDIYLG
jgi:replication-associated recombination protein RarA